MNPSFWTLTFFEYKKIFRRKSSWFALLLLIVAGLFLILSGVTGSSYVEGEKSVSHYEQMTTRRAYLRALEGELTAEVVAEVITQNQLAHADPAHLLAADDGHFVPDGETYARYCQPYALVRNMIAYVYAEGDYDYYAIDSLTPQDGERFYQARNQAVEKSLAEGVRKKVLSEEEATALLKLNSGVKQPIHIGAFEGCDELLNLSDAIAMILGIAIVILTAPIFAGEVQNGCSVVILSTKNGRGSAICAKLFTGLSLSMLLALAYGAACLLALLGIYGFDGANAAYQTSSILSVYPLTMLQADLIYLTILVFASGLIAAATMLCSALVKSPFSASIPMVLLVFLPVLIYLTPSSPLYRVLNLFPTRMVNSTHLLRSMMYEIGGLLIPTPVFYGLFCLIAGLGFCLWGGCRFRSRQAS